MSRKDNKGRVLKTGESQRKDGTYQYRYKDKLANKWMYIYAHDLAELREKEEEIVKQKYLNPCSSINPFFYELYEAWMNIQKVNIKPTTLVRYMGDYSRHIQPKLAQVRINDINYALLTNFYQDLAINKKLALKTIKGIYSIVNSIIKFAIRNRIIIHNPNTYTLESINKIVKKCKETTKNGNCLTEKQVEAFLIFLNTPQRKLIYAKVIVLLYTGMRASELCGLLWEDVDFEENIIHIRHNLIYASAPDGGYRYYLQTPKTESSMRDIPMLPIVRKTLFEIKQNQNIVVYKNEWIGFVFCTKNGNVTNQRQIYTSLKVVQQTYNKHQSNESLKIHFLAPHTLRHTFCSMMYAKGVNSKAMQEIMGHSDIKLTMNIYTEIEEDVKENELMKLVK